VLARLNAFFGESSTLIKDPARVFDDTVRFLRKPYGFSWSGGVERVVDSSDDISEEVERLLRGNMVGTTFDTAASFRIEEK
jgi:hypothetical protein